MEFQKNPKPFSFPLSADFSLSSLSPQPTSLSPSLSDFSLSLSRIFSRCSSSCTSLRSFSSPVLRVSGVGAKGPDEGCKKIVRRVVRTKDDLVRRVSCEFRCEVGVWCKFRRSSVASSSRVWCEGLCGFRELCERGSVGTSGDATDLGRASVFGRRRPDGCVVRSSSASMRGSKGRRNSSSVFITGKFSGIPYYVPKIFYQFYYLYLQFS